jgi:outer membrane lipoprotein-sorting protein
MTGQPRYPFGSAVILSALLAAWPFLHAETLADVEARIDASAPGFNTLTAKITKITHTAVINDDSSESGVIRMKRVKPGDLRVRIDFTKPDARSVAFAGKKYELYLPKIKTVQEFDLGKHGSLVDQFLLLGFGTSVRDLKKSYDIKLIDSQQVNGKKTARIELLPKSGKLKEHLTKVEMWIPETEGYPIQQKFHQPSGDYYLTTYSDLSWNPPLADDALKLDLPKGTKREFPQK